MAFYKGKQVAFSKPSFNTRDGTMQITENGEYVIETYEKVNVNVAGGGNDGISKGIIYKYSDILTLTIEITQGA